MLFKRLWLVIFFLVACGVELNTGSRLLADSQPIPPKKNCSEILAEIDKENPWSREITGLNLSIY